MSYSFVEKYLEEVAVLERFTLAAAAVGEGKKRRRAEAATTAAEEVEEAREAREAREATAAEG